MALTKEHRRKISQSVRAAKQAKKKQPSIALSQASSLKGLHEQEKTLISMAQSRDVFRNTYLGMNVETVRGVLDSVESGRLLEWCEFAESMLEGDPKLKGLVKQRKSAISARDLKIVPADSSPRAIAQAKFVTDVLKKVDDLQSAIRTLQDGIFFGVGACETIWTTTQTSDGIRAYVPKSIVPVLSKKLAIGEIKGAWKYMLSDYGRFRPDESNPIFEHPYKFLVHSPDDAQMPHFRGLFRSLAFVYLFKKLGVNYWVAGAEKHAFPSIYALVPPNTKPTAIANLVQNLYQLSNDGVGVMENTVELKTVDSRSSDGNSIYKDQLAYYDTVMTQLILGGTLVVEAASGPGGNRALGEVHERSKQEIIQADAQDLAETLKFGLVKPILELNAHLFGGDVSDLPTVKFDIVNQTYQPIGQVHVQSRAVTVNELRKEVNLPPTAWGEERAEFGAAVVTRTEDNTDKPQAARTDEESNELPEDDAEVEGVDPTTALNGAQVTALLQIIERVSMKLIPRATGVELIIAAFPIDRAMAERIMGDVGKSFVVSPEKLEDSEGVI